MSARTRARAIRLTFFLALATVLSCVPGTGLSSLLPGEAASAAPYCGATVTKTDGTPWVCTFADEFTGDSLDASKWVPITTAGNGFTSGSECFVNSANNVKVAQGALSLTVRKEARPLSCKTPGGSFRTSYTGGYVASWNRFAQTYGRYEIRARFPSTQTAGLQSALWLYPRTLTYGAWPASGEIDIAELFTRYPDRAIPYLHYQEHSADANVTNNYCMMDTAAWHTYVLEWTASSITIKYDDQVCLTTTTWYPDGLDMPAPFDHPYFLNLTQGLGVGGNAFNSKTTQLPATTQVDYVRVWS
ncbi:MAG TPA: glycoside hydrolase family 16 protein [Nocardioidaceae bacterium]|nr:glycoside hydrolase family 16 protein [Nocardioidaceae bacterium]